MIKPTTDRVAIEEIKQQEMLAGLEIVREDKQEMKIGRVVASGPDSTIAANDKVMYNPSAGTLIRLLEEGDWKEYRIMHSDTIQAIV